MVIIVSDTNNANNSVIIGIIEIIYADKNKWYNRSVISDIIVFFEIMK